MRVILSQISTIFTIYSFQLFLVNAVGITGMTARQVVAHPVTAVKHVFNSNIMTPLAPEGGTNKALLEQTSVAYKSNLQQENRATRSMDKTKFFMETMSGKARGWATRSMDKTKGWLKPVSDKVNLWKADKAMRQDHSISKSLQQKQIQLNRKVALIHSLTNAEASLYFRLTGRNFEGQRSGPGIDYSEYTNFLDRHGSICKFSRDRNSILYKREFDALQEQK